jgi:cellulose biosynthesis protein BcsQ
MAKIIAFTNQAGGVGKSTSVVNIAPAVPRKK